MTKSEAPRYTTRCECCGAEDALLMILPCGGFGEFTPECLAALEEQVARDALADAI